MPLVSIILPVYNGEKYIDHTLQSICNQSFKDFEMIVVDDGSEDKSREIIEENAAKDSRIRLLCQKNKGICEARNAGISEAKAEYLMFCDHDDVFMPGYIQQAYCEISTGNYDFVKYGYREIYIKGGKEYRSNCCLLPNSEYHRENMTEFLIAYSNYNEYVWDGIYKKELVVKLGMFDPWFKAGCEDIDLMLRLAKAAEACKTSSSVYYEHYIRNASSTSRKYSENTYEAVLKSYLKRIGMVTEEGAGTRRYIALKTVQLLWAVLGMFSLSDCPLTYRQIRQRLIKVSEIPGLKAGLTVRGVNGLKKIIIFLYKIGMYGMLARICLMKRRISK